MVDDARVRRLLRHLVDTVQYLESEAAAPAEIRSQRRWLDSAKYNFVTAIENAVDIGQHICAVRGWGPPDTNAEVFALLAEHDALPVPLAEDLRRASGFRNVLVHDYVEVRDELVIANLNRLTDLREFATAIADWLADD